MHFATAGERLIMHTLLHNSVFEVQSCVKRPEKK